MKPQETNQFKTRFSCNLGFRFRDSVAFINLDLDFTFGLVQTGVVLIVKFLPGFGRT